MAAAAALCCCRVRPRERRAALRRAPAVDDLETTLKAASVTHEIYRYDAAHAFANERSAAYDVACANQAWERMAAFLGVLIA